jgi:hypothetical protein
VRDRSASLPETKLSILLLICVFAGALAARQLSSNGLPGLLGQSTQSTAVPAAGKGSAAVLNQPKAVKQAVLGEVSSTGAEAQPHWQNTKPTGEQAAERTKHRGIRPAAHSFQ